MAKAKSTQKQKNEAPPSKLKRAVRYWPLWLLFLVAVILGILNANDTRTGIPFTGRSSNANTTTNNYGGLYNADAPLASLFTTSVEYWEPAIREWAQAFDLNPNLIATVMQIESCGHPYITSPAGAQGPFQVMPLHFDAGENQLDIDTNAHAGLNHMKDCLNWTTDLDLDGFAESVPNVGLALVCYNGGPGMIYDEALWVDESYNYYRWGTGIWSDAAKGNSSSETLNVWLNSGGLGLCQRSETAIESLDPLQRS